MKPTDLQALGSAVLKGMQGAEIAAKELWATQPALVLVLRRPGCVLCRSEAQKLWELHDKIQAQGVNMACVVKEWREREIAAFTPEFWGGPVYHDTTMAFYKAVNDGQNVKRGSLMGLVNPFGAVWKRIMEARKTVPKHNVVGEGLIMGGLMVVGKGGSKPYFVHLETDLGVTAAHDDVMKAVQQSAADAVADTSPTA